MRVLVVSEFFPADPRRDVFGVHQRLALLVEALGDLGHLDLLFFVSPQLDVSRSAVAAHEARLEQKWGVELSLGLVHSLEDLGRRPLGQIAAAAVTSVATGACSCYYPHVSLRTFGPLQRKAVAHRLDRRPDLVLTHRVGAMAPLLSMRRTLPPVLFDLDDIEPSKLERLRLPGESRITRALRRCEIAAARRAVRRASGRASRTLVCSESDARKVLEINRAARVLVIPNAVALPTASRPAHEPTMLFLGTYEYAPNVLAAEELIRKIWPTVRRAVPRARLLIAGDRPQAIPSFAAAPRGVEFTGLVSDLDRLYRQVRLICCPIRQGSGTRIKILEAAAYAKSAVATPIAAEGLSFTAEEEILLREEPSAVAHACIELLRDPQRCERIGSKARQRVRSCYARGDIVQLIRNHAIDVRNESQAVARSPCSTASDSLTRNIG